MSVKPQWMNKGLGKKMLNEVIQYLKSKGYEGSYSAVVSSVS
jgi:predicted N-acetyltransferase YhbS